MATDSKIVLGIASLPSDNLPKDLYDDFLSLYRAIKNLADKVSEFTGIDPPDQLEWAESTASRTILSGNHTRLYVVANVAINAGQLVNLFDFGGGVLRARLASASAANTMAHAICTQSVAAGQIAPLQWLRAYVNQIGGMTSGVLYWLSPTAGFVQNVAPVAAGTIRQPIGVAIAPSQLLMDISLLFIQN